MAGKITSYRAQARRQVEAGVSRNLEAAAIFLANHAKELVSVEGTGVGGTGKLIYDAVPSKPGEPPHVQTGRGRASIIWDLQGLVARVGTNVKYMRWLELGTHLIAARPWLRRSTNECWATLKILVSRPFR